VPQVHLKGERKNTGNSCDVLNAPLTATNLAMLRASEVESSKNGKLTVENGQSITSG